MSLDRRLADAEILALGHFILGVPIRGSLLLLYIITLPFIIAVLGIGLLISTAVRPQTQAMQLSTFYMLPSILLTGFMFPREAMPVVVRELGLLLPMTYYITIVRGIALKNVGLADVWQPAVVLTRLCVVVSDGEREALLQDHGIEPQHPEDAIQT